MKYRCLSDEELAELESEFKQFLIANGVHTEEWEKLNKESDPKVMELVEIFSDIVLDKALKNIKYLEHITDNDIKSFKCNDKEMILIGITSKNKTLNFKQNALSDFADDLDIFRTSKPYHKERELEVFELLESGCTLIDEERFKKIEMAHTYSTKQMKN